MDDQTAVYKDEQTQKELNTPLKDPKGVGEENEKFLKLVISLIDDGKIELHTPATLMNTSVYDDLSEKDKGNADTQAMILIAAVREIKDLHDAGHKDTFQMENLVERVRNSKERVESESGDIFLI